MDRDRNQVALPHERRNRIQHYSSSRFLSNPIERRSGTTANATGSSTMVAPNNVYTYDPFCFTVLLHQDVTNLATRHPKNPGEFTELATLIRLFCQVDMIVSFRYPTCQDGQTENNLAPTNARTLPNGH